MSERRSYSRVEVLADTLVEDAWQDEELWPSLDVDGDGRPAGKDIDKAKLNLGAALQSAYEDWLAGENDEYSTS